MKISSSLRIGIAFTLAWLSLVPAREASAGTDDIRAASIPPVFLPVVSKFAKSPIPVFYPTWIPPDTFSSYHGRIYPLFCIDKGEGSFGPSYDLGLFTDRRYCDHADRLFEVYGVAGGGAVTPRTHPVWLGKSGWAYIDPDGNSGWIISVVRAAGHPQFIPGYAYTVLGACQQVGVSRGQLFACLKRVAVSLRQYVPRAGK